MTDREMLELAAKAAGIRLEWDGSPAAWLPIYYEGKTYDVWDPRKDDGESRRLAVRLHLVVGCYESYASACGTYTPDSDEVPPEMVVWHSEVGGDAAEAARLAVLRAAAEIGRKMP